MAYNRSSGVMEKLDSTQLKVFTNLSEGIPIGKQVEMEILEAEQSLDFIKLVFRDGFGHQARQRIFVRDRSDQNYSFALRQLLASITHSSQMFKHLVGDERDGGFSLLTGSSIKLQYELGNGFYIAGYMGSFIIINENYEMMSEIQHETLADARQAALKLGLKEGWPQITGFMAPKSAVQMANTIKIEHALGDTYAIDSDTDDIFGSARIDTPTEDKSKTYNSTHQVERDGHIQVSSTLPESKRF